MAVEGRNENVFIQSPRVGFGEPPASAATSLLTFADMVLSFDRKTVLENIAKPSPAPHEIVDSKDFDHTYASSRSTRTTRSQTAKAAQIASTEIIEMRQDSNQHEIQDIDLDLDLEIDLERDEDLDNTGGGNIQQRSVKASELHFLSQSPPSAGIEPQRLRVGARKSNLKSARCSSAESISSEVPHPISSKGDKSQDWPCDHMYEKLSRKSSSYETMDNSNHPEIIKSSDAIPKGVSQTLHRLVNNTVEFPCWPRKADHTYATATWDGTAASHNLFERDNIPNTLGTVQDQPMECVSSTPIKQLTLTPMGVQLKDDHTYVKHTFSGDHSTMSTCSNSKQETPKSQTIPDEVYNKSGKNCPSQDHAFLRQRFSSATFPRLKSREDHTYFHSGFCVNSSNASNHSRDWVSSQTVAELSQDMQIEETYRSLHSFSQSASAKKDHNYSTSA